MRMRPWQCGGGAIICFCLGVGLLLSLLIECAQFVLGCGISEIDDLLLNTLGAMAGYACLPLARLVSGKHEK